MKTNKEYRFKDNPKEKEMHDKFIELFKRDNSAHKSLSAIIFGWQNDSQTTPNRYLNNDEERKKETVLIYVTKEQKDTLQEKAKNSS